MRRPRSELAFGSVHCFVMFKRPAWSVVPATPGLAQRSVLLIEGSQLLTASLSCRRASTFGSPILMSAPSTAHREDVATTPQPRPKPSSLEVSSSPAKNSTDWPANRPSGTSGRARRPRRRITVAWIAPENMEHPEWVAAGLSLGEMGRISNWWVGDWLRYGTTRWGEKYVEAARITGLDGKTLRNLVYVASRFDVSRRRDKLTWSHHAEVAAISPAEQDYWLSRAADDRLSVADLRLELRTAARGAQSQDCSAPPVSTDRDGIVCPQCGHRLPASALRDGAA
jgi:hypothetical protein